MTKSVAKTDEFLAPRLGQRLREELEQYDLAERDANLRGIRIGLICLQAKAALPHGTYEAWVAQHVGQVRIRQVQNLTALSKQFLAAKKLSAEQVQQICTSDAAGGQGQPTEEQQLLLDFIGGRTQAEMFDAHGISVRKPGRPIGGDNAMRTWLLKHHPEYGHCNSARHLPKAIRAEYDAYMDHLARTTPQVDLQEIETKGWHREADKALAILRTYFLANKYYTDRDRMWKQQQRDLIRACLVKLDESLKDR
jgi:hypothetical protein